MQKKKKRKESQEAILTSDKIEFKTKTLTKYKEGNYIIRNGAILEGNITFLNTHTSYMIPHNKANIKRYKERN